MIVGAASAAGVIVYLVTLWFHRQTVNSLLAAFAEEQTASREERKRLVAATLARTPGEFAVYTREPRPKKEKPFADPEENVPVGL